MIYRGQILVREAGKSQQHWSQTQYAETRTDYAMVGLLDVPDYGYDEHIIRGFVGHAADASFCLLPTDFVRVLHDHQATEIGGLATHPVWPRPHPVTQFGGGGLVLRNTRMPTAPGRRVVFILVVCSLPPGSLKNHHLYEVKGNVGCWPSAPNAGMPGCIELQNPVPVDLPAGLSLQMLLKEPIWGWDEKVAFNSTMDLPTIDDAQAIQDLLDADHLDADAQAKLDRMLTTPAGGIFHISRDDPMYHRFRHAMTREQGPIRWDAVLPASIIQQRKDAADRIIRQLMDEAQ